MLVLQQNFFQRDVGCLEVASKALQRKYVQCGFGPPGCSFDSLEVWDDSSRPRKSVAGVIFCIGGRGTNGDPFR